MLAKTAQFVKSLVKGVKPYLFDLFVLACVILIGLISYNLGRSHALKKTSLRVEEGTLVYDARSGENEGSSALTANAAQAAKPRDPRVVVSKSSKGKVYHFTWCPGAKQIKEENKIWFATEAEAQKAGYTLAGNCS
jgi:hypothetical protein